MNSFIIALLVLLPSLSHAQGDHSGGGGDYMMCEGPPKHGFFSFLQKRPVHYLLRDVFEANETTDHHLNLGAPELSIPAKIDLIRKDFSTLDPLRAERYADEALKIIADLDSIAATGKAKFGLAVFLTGKGIIEDIDDAGDDYIWLQCPKGQLVRQEPPVLGPGPYYTFYRRAWKKLDADNKVATLFHEVVYREFREAQWAAGIETPTVSRSARKLNYVLFSQHAHNQKLGGNLGYLKFLSDNLLRNYVFRGKIGSRDLDVNLYNLVAKQNVWSAKFSPDGYVTDVSLQYAGLKPGSLPFSGLRFNNIESLSFDRNRQLTGLNGKFGVIFDPATRKVTDVNSACEAAIPNCIRSNNIGIELDGTLNIKGTAGTVRFDNDGNVLSVLH